jgi:mercuric ion transport protein
MKLQLIYFAGCPNAEAARAALREALAAERLHVPVEEIDVESPDAPASARGWGSPTILVDGIDVAGQQPSASAACRLYPSGAPSVHQIRERLANARGETPTRVRVAAPIVGAVAAAFAASACCLVPAVLAAVGVSGAAFGTFLAPYRPLFVLGTAVALGVGFWVAYRRPKDACGCAAPRPSRRGRAALWIAAVVALGLAAYPSLTNSSASVGAIDAPATETLRLKITGMDCPECTGMIAKRIKQVPGVIAATVDYETGSAMVQHDGRGGIAQASVSAVLAAGFRAEVQP